MSQLYGVTQPLVFKGHYEFRVLRGNVNIGGVILAASLDWIPVSCPMGPFFAIKPQFTTTLDDFIDPGLKQQYLDVPCVIEVRSPDLMHLAALAPPFKSLFEPLQQMSSSTDQHLLWTPLPSWQQLLALDPQDRLVLVGPKNSGKSSAARYVANSNRNAYILDLDPGQCEFTPPGTMALKRITRPDFSAPYIRAADFAVVRAHTLGYVSPMDTPGRYLEIAQNLLDCYPGDAPLVVNTPGWTKGLGLELVREIILMVRATKAAHMGHDESYEELQEQLLAKMGLCMLVVEPVESASTKFSASDLRNLQTICYFNKNNPKHITQWAPYEIAFDASDTTGAAIAGVAVLDSEFIDMDDYDKCIEGTIVAINQLTVSVPIDEKHALPIVGPEVQLAEISCTIGYAVIQKLTAQGCRLLTPMNPEIITGPIVLVRGRLDIPMYLLWDQQAIEAPWLIAKNPPGVGSVYTKFRRNIGRT